MVALTFFWGGDHVSNFFLEFGIVFSGFSSSKRSPISIFIIKSFYFIPQFQKKKKWEIISNRFLHSLHFKQMV